MTCKFHCRIINSPGWSCTYPSISACALPVSRVPCFTSNFFDFVLSLLFLLLALIFPRHDVSRKTRGLLNHFCEMKTESGTDLPLPKSLWIDASCHCSFRSCWFIYIWSPYINTTSHQIYLFYYGDKLPPLILEGTTFPHISNFPQPRENIGCVDVQKGHVQDWALVLCMQPGPGELLSVLIPTVIWSHCFFHHHTWFVARLFSCSCRQTQVQTEKVHLNPPLSFVRQMLCVYVCNVVEPLHIYVLNRWSRRAP